MKIRYKKFWILYDGKEIIQEVDKERDEDITGYTYSGMYSDGISNTEGNYIMIPLNEDITEYRKKLILYIINKELNFIERSKEKIKQLIAKI